MDQENQREKRKKRKKGKSHFTSLHFCPLCPLVDTVKFVLKMKSLHEARVRVNGGAAIPNSFPMFNFNFNCSPQFVPVSTLCSGIFCPWPKRWDCA